MLIAMRLQRLRKAGCIAFAGTCRQDNWIWLGPWNLQGGPRVLVAMSPMLTVVEAV